MSPIHRSFGGLLMGGSKAAQLALFGAALLVAPLAIARAADAPPATDASAMSPETAAEAKAETIQARIAKLHTDLKITADQQGKWDAVANTMRDNAVAMDSLIAAKRAQTPAKMTAVDDLMVYQEFAKAHLDGLTNLTTSFRALYEAMPAGQKANADEVFARFGADRAAHKG